MLIRPIQIRRLPLIILTFAVLVVCSMSARGAEPETQRDSQAEEWILPALDEVLERYVEALGGRHAIEKLKTRVCRGRMITDLPSRDPPVYEVDTLEFYAKAPDRYLVVARTAQSGTMSEGWNGILGWKHNSAGMRSIDRAQRSKPALLYNPQGALHLMSDFPGMTVRGRQVLHGRHVIVVDTGSGMWLHFDCQTGLLVSLGHGELHDYRRVDGVMVPHRVVYSRKGGSSTLIVDHISHNHPFDESLFARPNPYAIPWD
jgi:hypothetical protein